MNNILNILLSLSLIFVLLTFFNVYVPQPVQIEGQSMMPTLHDGEVGISIAKKEYERFDIIIFPDPMGSDHYYVKRLLGLPGDQIEVQNQQLFINGQPLVESYLPDEEAYETTDFTLRSIIGQEEIPEGYYFVMGDHRTRSGDSRQFGLIPISSIEGRLKLIIYPFKEFKFFN